MRSQSYSTMLLGLALYFCVGAAMAGPEVRKMPERWEAAWIVDPAVAAGDSKGALPNSHSFYRKVFFVPKAAAQARCFVTADDMYKLYLNGRFVGQGPAPCFPDSTYVNSYDVTRFLRSDEPNVLAVHAYYQGLVNRVWVSGDGLSGIILQLEVRYQDGSRQIVGTDSSWKVQRSPAYTGEPTGYKTQFLENVDGRLLPWGWRQPDFDDSSWPSALETGRPPLVERHLVPQPTPPLEHDVVHPVLVKRIGPGHYLVDFGREVVGTLGLRLRGPRGHVVEIRHGEELGSRDSVRYKLRANCTYREFYTLAGRSEEVFEFYDYRGFRYAEILNSPCPVGKETIWVTERHYPFGHEITSFQCSDTLLQAIWDLCVRSVRAGAQEVYVDCPTREKGQYLGDSYITGTSHFYLTGETRLQRKALQNFAQTARLKPTLLCVAPCAFRQEIADYSLEWLLFLRDYAWFSGDFGFVRQVWPTAQGLLKGFRGWENESGLLEAVPTMNLVDWPPNLRDGYDMKRAEKGVNTVLNAFYFAVLQAAAELADSLGRRVEARQYAGRAEKVERAFNDLLLDRTKGLYVDALGSNHVSLHANTLPLTFGLAPDSLVPRLVAYVGRKGLACGVYFAAFVLRGLYRAGASELAYDMLTSQDLHSWANMLRKGATTTLEAWDPDLKWNTSWCHAWATAPVFVTVEEIVGLKPAVPGWREIRLEPHVPKRLKEAKIRLNLPVGEVAAAFHNDGGRLMYEIEVPHGVALSFVPEQKKITVASVDNLAWEEGRPVRLSSGCHRIELLWRR